MSNRKVIYDYLVEHVRVMDKSNISSASTPVFTWQEIEQFADELAQLLCTKQPRDHKGRFTK